MVVSIQEKWYESKEQFYLLQIGIYYFLLHLPWLLFWLFIFKGRFNNIISSSGLVKIRAGRYNKNEARAPVQS
jgi:hypothetical protein